MDVDPRAYLQIAAFSAANGAAAASHG